MRAASTPAGALYDYVSDGFGQRIGFLAG